MFGVSQEDYFLSHLFSLSPCSCHVSQFEVSSQSCSSSFILSSFVFGWSQDVSCIYTSLFISIKHFIFIPAQDDPSILFSDASSNFISTSSSLSLLFLLIISIHSTVIIIKPSMPGHMLIIYLTSSWKSVRDVFLPSLIFSSLSEFKVSYISFSSTRYTSFHFPSVPSKVIIRRDRGWKDDKENMKRHHHEQSMGEKEREPVSRLFRQHKKNGSRDQREMLCRREKEMAGGSSFLFSPRELVSLLFSLLCPNNTSMVISSLTTTAILLSLMSWECCSNRVVSQGWESLHTWTWLHVYLSMKRKTQGRMKKRREIYKNQEEEQPVFSST